jgi:tRNA(fMet)-specific endonuclease VapC
MAYLLDTNIISDILRNPRGAAADRLRRLEPQEVATSIVVLGELRYGLSKKPHARLEAQLNAVLAALDVLPLDAPSEDHYGKLRAELDRRGTPIGANDLWIAAHALALDRVLVTANVGEFGRVAGLKVENWLSAT